MQRNIKMDYKRKINYYETDNMGIVHHSNYIRYFEEARIFALDAVGLNYADIERMGILIPVLECECKYIKSARFGMSLTIETRITAFDGVRMEMSYTAVNDENGDTVVTGKTRHCFLNGSFKPLSLPLRSITRAEIRTKFLKNLL